MDYVIADIQRIRGSALRYFWQNSAAAIDGTNL